jgi:tetratricopeptide (TPR) repeat protein
VITHLERALAFTHTDTPADKLHKLEDALTSSTSPLADLVPLFAALLSLPPPAHYPPLTLTPQRQHQKTLEALLTWLGQETDRHPVLCIVEDLHWVDPSTLEFLSLLVDQSPTARIMVLLTCRPEFTPPWPSRAHCTSLTLTRLPRPQVERLVASVAGAKALPREVVQQIVAKTDGVPLFVEELTKTVLESGLLQEHADHYELTGPLPALAIPATLQDSLMARLDRLSTVKAVAQLGATLGRQFAYDLLQAIAPMDEGTLQQGLRQLVEAELLYQRGLPPQATYLFKHALIQDTAYQSLLKSTRQHYHQRIAQVLEARFADVVETQPELLAYHYTEAGFAEQAVEYWQRAGYRARQRVGDREAITHFRKGLDVLQTLPHTRERIRQEVDMLLNLHDVLGNTQGPAEAEPLLTRARVLCEPLGDTPQLFRVLYHLQVSYQARAEHQTARECGEQALTLAQRLQDPALFPSAHNRLGLTLMTLGDLTAARGHFEQAIAGYDARRGDFVWGHTVQALSHLAHTLWLLGYPGRAVQRNHEALSLVQERPTPASHYLALYQASTLHQLCREVHAVHEQTEAAIALVSEEGASRFLPRLLHRRGWVLAVQGQYEAGIAQMFQALTTLRAAGEVYPLEGVDPSALAQLAEAYGQSGRVEEGLSLLAEARAAVEHTGARFWEAEVQRLTGELLLRQAVPDEEQADACFQQALDIACRQQAKSLELRAATSRARLWQRQGKHTEAREILVEVYGWFTEGFDTADLQEAKALLEALA